VNVIAVTSIASRRTGADLLGALVIWAPALVISGVVVPLMRGAARAQEYETDAQAVAAGYGPGLLRALAEAQRLGASRPSRGALMATHPPAELRIEMVERQLALQAGEEEVMPLAS
jgi:Zn-dependent protease with chaperone function